MKQNKIRTKYIDKIKPFIDNDIIKVFIGQRRVGKSFVLLSIIDLLQTEYGVKSDQIIYINKESVERDHINSYQKLYEAVKNFKYIFVDEIQDIPEWQKAIRSLKSEGNRDIYITGSNSNLLSGEFATLLSGRYISISIYPLDYKEFLEFYNKTNNKESFIEYTKIGGMPYLMNLQNQEEQAKTQYLSDVFDAIILKDIIYRYKIRNSDFFGKLLQFVARNVGSVFSSTSVSEFLSTQNIKIGANVILEYLDYATMALCLNKVSRYDLKGKRIFEKKQKYFFTDIGIRNTTAGGYASRDISSILENVVYCNLASNGRKVSIGEIAGKEIDFIAEKNSQKVYVQVCYLLTNKETVEREFGVYENVKDGRPRYVVSLDDIIGTPDEGVTHMSIFDFLQNVACK